MSIICTKLGGTDATNGQLADVDNVVDTFDAAALLLQPMVIIPLPFSTVIQGTWAMSSAADIYIGMYANGASAADADEVNYTIRLSGGTYTLGIIYTKTDDAGILKAYLDTTLIATLDMYNVATVANSVSTTTSISVTGGSYTFKLKLDGKNGSSSSYIARLNQVILIKTA